MPLPLATAHAEEDKPMWLLHNWAVFDARPSMDAGGALALALISLHALGDTLDSTDVGCAPEGAGDASPYCENEEDAGQEDDGGYDDDDGGGDEEEVTTVSVRLRLDDGDCVESCWIVRVDASAGCMTCAFAASAARRR